MQIYMSLIADFLMVVASGSAAVYCIILSRRLTRLTSFDKGIGGAIAVLSAQVDEMKAALADAKQGTDGAGTHLQGLVRQARDISSELELMIAACHDFAEQALVVQQDASLPPTPAPVTAAEGRAPVASPSPPPVVRAVEREVPAGPAEENVPTPIFGTRRLPPPDPAFRRRAQG